MRAAFEQDDRTNHRGAKQIAYHIRVAGTVEKLAADAGDSLDSGRIESDQTTHVAYGRNRIWYRRAGD